jgi:hypothetical protein
MAGKILGSLDCAASTPENVYTVPASAEASMTVSICNRSAAAVTIRLSLSATTATMADSEYIEYETSVPAYGVLERTGIIMDAGKFLVAYSSAIDVTFMAYGFEEAI